MASSAGMPLLFTMIIVSDAPNYTGMQLPVHGCLQIVSPKPAFF